MKNSIEAAGACLDNNHTHFFLVDNGTVNQYGKEIQFRAQLEKQIMKMEVDKSEILTPSCVPSFYSKRTKPFLGDFLGNNNQQLIC